MLDPKVVLEDICDITGCQCECYTPEELLDEITALCGEYLKSKSPYFIFDEDTGKYIERG
jgi:hypothetical protein